MKQRVHASSVASTAVFVVMMSATSALLSEGVRAQSLSESSLDGRAIIQRLEEENLARERRVHSYTDTRRYSVNADKQKTVSELVVTMRFDAPSSRTFKTTSNSGVGWVHRRVFGRLMEAEQTASGSERATSAVNTDNYDAELIRSEQRNGRDCYVVSLRPKHSGKYLFKGYAWIDKGDFAIARLEGEPAQSPSFWVVQTPFVREFQRIDGFWLPTRDETHSRIRFAGEYVLLIQYSDYHINARSDY